MSFIQKVNELYKKLGPITQVIDSMPTVLDAENQANSASLSATLARSDADRAEQVYTDAKTYFTIADLQNETNLVSKAFVSGYHTKGDGAFGSNIFEWDENSEEDEINGVPGIIVKPNNITGAGRYKLRFLGEPLLSYQGWDIASAIKAGVVLDPILINNNNEIIAEEGDSDRSIMLQTENAKKCEVFGVDNNHIQYDRNLKEIKLHNINDIFGETNLGADVANKTKYMYYDNICKIQVFRDQNYISGQLAENIVTPIESNNNLTSITAFGEQIMVYDKANDYWKAIVQYYSSYGNDNQVKILNLTTKVEDRNYDNFLEGTPLNGANYVTANDLNTYIRFANKLVKYDTNSGDLEVIGDLPLSLGTNILYPSLKLGIDGKLVLGGSLDGVLSVAEYDIANNTYTEWNNLNSNDTAANKIAVSDNTYIYQTTNGNGTGYRIYAMKRSDNSVVKLADCSGWVNPYQGKYGVWISIPSGSTDTNGNPLSGHYWLYNGTLIEATNGYEQGSCPWDNHGEPFKENSGVSDTTPYQIDNNGVEPPSGSNVGSFWFKRNYGDDFENIVIPNIHKYPVEIKYAIGLKSTNKIISVGLDYNGYAVKNLDTGEVNSYSGLLSNYSWVEGSNGKLYLSGYPSGMLFEYDPKLPWDNTVTSYNPNTSALGTNPKFIGYTRYNSPSIGGASIGGTGGGQHKNFVLLEDDNKIWCFGEYERDGTGLGVTSVDLADSYRMVGYRDSATMSNYIPRRGCVTKDYIVCLCETRSGTNSLSLSIMNKETKFFTFVDLPDSLKLKWAKLTKYGSDIINYGTNKVCISSADELNRLILLGFDLDTYTVLYEKSFFQAYNPNGGAFQKMSDDNIYLGFDKLTVIVEPIRGLIESVSKVDLTYYIRSRVEASNGDVYAIFGTNIYNLGKNKNKKTLNDVSGVEISGTPSVADIYSHITITNNNDGTYTFDDDGSYTGYYDIHMTLTKSPINTLDYKFNLLQESGATHLQTIIVGGDTTGIYAKKDLVYGNNYFSGVVTNPVGTEARLQMHSTSGVSSRFTLAVHSVKERNN